MKLYEILFVARNELVESQVNEISEGISGYITKNGGEVKFSHYFGIRSLAYEIQKNKKGHYVVMHFTLNPGDIKELDRMIRLNEDVIRFIIVNIEESNPDDVLAMLTVKDKDFESDDDSDDAIDSVTDEKETAVKDHGYRVKASDIVEAEEETEE